MSFKSLSLNQTGQIPVIILNYNNADDTINCVKSVLNQTYKNPFIYLLDNNSKKEDYEILQQEYGNQENIKLIRFDENLGFTRAHNYIFKNELQNKKYEWVILLNNDAIADQKFIENLLKTAHQTHAELISAKAVNFFNRKVLDNIGHKFLNTGEILPLGFAEDPKKYQDNFNNAGPSACACMYKCSVFHDIGSFDEYFITGYEDAEFGLRAILAGYHSIIAHDAVVYHKMGKTINQYRDYKYNLKIQKDIIYSFYKLMPVSVIIINSIFIVPRTIILLLLFLLFLRFKYLRIFFHAWYQIIFQDRKQLKEARRKAKTNRKLSTYQILKLQTFFLFDNIKRFWTIFIKGSPTIFEK